MCSAFKCKFCIQCCCMKPFWNSTSTAIQPGCMLALFQYKAKGALVAPFLSRSQRLLHCNHNTTLKFGLMIKSYKTIAKSFCKDLRPWPTCTSWILNWIEYMVNIVFVYMHTYKKKFKLKCSPCLIKLRVLIVAYYWHSLKFVFEISIIYINVSS